MAPPRRRGAPPPRPRPRPTRRPRSPSAPARAPPPARRSQRPRPPRSSRRPPRRQGEEGEGVGEPGRRDAVSEEPDEEELAFRRRQMAASREQQQETTAAAKRRVAQATKKARNVAAGDREPEFLDEPVPADEACAKWPQHGSPQVVRPGSHLFHAFPLGRLVAYVD
ncbi:hypothetical protein ZWY2020_055719 [Hordeum vulgare]|nr:hypothetical protein ZWY2020_055719 [Hordeum vulgare]